MPAEVLERDVAGRLGVVEAAVGVFLHHHRRRRGGLGFAGFGARAALTALAMCLSGPFRSIGRCGAARGGRRGALRRDSFARQDADASAGSFAAATQQRVVARRARRRLSRPGAGAGRSQAAAWVAARGDQRATGAMPDLDRLAEDWIALWQSELAALAADPELAGLWRQALATGAAWLRAAAAARPAGCRHGAATWPGRGFAPPPLAAAAGRRRRMSRRPRRAAGPAPAAAAPGPGGDARPGGAAAPAGDAQPPPPSGRPPGRAGTAAGRARARRRDAAGGSPRPSPPAATGLRPSAPPSCAP